MIRSGGPFVVELQDVWSNDLKILRVFWNDCMCLLVVRKPQMYGNLVPYTTILIGNAGFPSGFQGKLAKLAGKADF